MCSRTKLTIIHLLAISITTLFFCTHLTLAEQRLQVQLSYAPNVPAPLQRNPSKVRVDLETKEVTARLADGVDYNFWTFGGTVPGPMIRIMEGDEVEFHLSNHPFSKMPHNIDLHAVTGPGGGAASSLTAPGHTSTFSFKALNAGLYVYHCATAPVGMHIANGMYGLILVEPEGGLPPVDREFYVMQSDFYTKGEYGEEGFQPFSMEKAIDEDADYVVFNGSVGAMVGDRAVRAKVGETIRLYVGNGGPNLVSSFHVIGEIFDTVYTEGGTLPNQQNVQSTLIPAGGSAIVEFKVEVPGALILVDHSIFRAFNKGALGMINVEGPDNSLVYSGKQADTIYLPEGGAIQEVAVANEEPAIPLTPEERLQRGQRIYEQNCAACHQMDGEGISGVFPPLANSDYLMQDLPRAVRVVISGLTGEIDVNGKKYNNIMPSQRLNDHDISNVIGYITNTWGNQAELLSAAEVAEIRAALANH